MSKTRLLALIAAACATGLVVAFAPPPQSESEPPAASHATAPTAGSAQRFDALPARAALGTPAGEPFSAPPWEARPPAAAARSPAVEARPAPPSPPAMPYRVAGRVVNADGAHVILAKGDAVLAVREGDMLDGGYRIEAIAPDRVTLVYVALNAAEDLPIASSLALDAPLARAALAPLPQAAGRAPAAGAQLRWEGPRQVRAGETFDVALRLTSPQAVRASPVQLHFDAKVVQPVGVRAGGFFADGIFSYRVNPSGSIFVGAAGKGAVPADAELLVVTFRPVQAGTTAELKVSSLVLQGTAGAIPHEHPASFRTAISR